MKARTRIIALVIGAILVAACATLGPRIDKWTGTTRVERCADLQVGVVFYDNLLAQREAAYEADPDAEMPVLSEGELASRAVAQALLDSCKASAAAAEAAKEAAADAVNDAATAVEEVILPLPERLGLPE